MDDNKWVIDFSGVSLPTTHSEEKIKASSKMSSKRSKDSAASDTKKYFELKNQIEILKNRGFINKGNVVVNTGSTPVEHHLPTNIIKITKVE